MNTSQTFTV